MDADLRFPVRRESYKKKKNVAEELVVVTMPMACVAQGYAVITGAEGRRDEDRVDGVRSGFWTASRCRVGTVSYIRTREMSLMM